MKKKESLLKNKYKIKKQKEKKRKKKRDFPGGTVVKNPPANVGDMGSNPGLGRSHMQRSS